MASHDRDEAWRWVIDYLAEQLDEESGRDAIVAALKAAIPYDAADPLEKRHGARASLIAALLARMEQSFDPAPEQTISRQSGPFLCPSK